jgi:hypothetical protein
VEFAVVPECTAMSPLVISLLVENAVAEWLIAKQLRKRPR